ncbi:hypothetical protein FHE74_00315 [Corynebacterium tapiri]|uniref:Uncharacterized protein n=1 Tax=Corynebacterium tapiri TaxID=1448266 RepID=A0A5C4U7X4_9CORY|nr:hypothetical protein FHE74_00315 [Corynebacterium tapiri]
MSQAGEAFDDTRVLHEGGSGEVAAPRMPRLRASDVRRAPRDSQDYEVVAAEPEEFELVDEPASRKDVLDGEVVEDQQPTEQVVSAGGSTAASALVLEDEDEVEEAGAGEAYEVDASYEGPSDTLHPAARADAAASYQPAPRDEEAELTDEPAELSEEEIEFARRRSERGGWDPDADRTRTLDRYARRRRALAIIVGVGLISVVLGIIFGGWVWAAAAVTGVILVAYLAALRTQVRQENELRARRIRHLRRARMGVRQVDAPERFRRPGGVVVQLDDASPDFDYLPEARYTVDDAPEPHQPLPRRRPLRRAS